MKQTSKVSPLRLIASALNLQALRVMGFTSTAFVVIATISMPVASAESVACAELYDELSALLKETDCRQHTDCFALQLPPPFGCNIPINRRFAGDAEEIRDEYQRACGVVFQCMEPARKLSCENRHCVVKPSAQLPGVPSNGTINRHARPLGRGSCR